MRQHRSAVLRSGDQSGRWILKPASLCSFQGGFFLTGCSAGGLPALVLVPRCSDNGPNKLLPDHSGNWFIPNRNSRTVHTASCHNCTIVFAGNMIEGEKIDFGHAIVFVNTTELNVTISSIMSPVSLIGSLAAAWLRLPLACIPFGLRGLVSLTANNLAEP